MDPFGHRNPTNAHQNGAARGSRGRGAGSLRGRGGGRGGTSRSAKRARPSRSDDLDDNEANEDDEEVDEAPKRRGKKRQKATPITGPKNPPVEIHRRKTSLRDRLIKGDYEPQAVGMRVYNMKKAAAAAAAAANAAQAPATPASARHPPREFLTPVEPRQETTTTPAPAANNLASGNTAADNQPNPRIAYKSTPTHQLHFPEALVLALKQNTSKWEAKEHAQSSVFVVARIVESDIADMHVFTSLRDATADALYMIVHEHPEAFALRRDKDDDGKEIKLERSEQASTVIQQITARPAFRQVPKTADQSNANGDGVEEDDSLFVVKTEYPERPRPPRITDPHPDFNGRGELLLRDAPEPTYVFWGRYKICSFGLKMEARRADGAAVKVSVHLKNLRKPADT
ncbi:hypothetical protein F4823DRAFT_633332 [Ustulina deusta]|nr:hypothetical protein F4823DRAFT_633332 [Ustulina deusta]